MQADASSKRASTGEPCCESGQTYTLLSFSHSSSAYFAFICSASACFRITVTIALHCIPSSSWNPASSLVVYPLRTSHFVIAGVLQACTSNTSLSLNSSCIPRFPISPICSTIPPNYTLHVSTHIHIREYFLPRINHLIEAHTSA